MRRRNTELNKKGNTSRRPKIFVAMPFAKRFNPVYEDVIRPALQEIGNDVERVDEIYKSTPIIEDIERGIKNADIFLADLSERNPNVLYELGYARGIGKPLVLITRRIKDVPFHLSVSCIGGRMGVGSRHPGGLHPAYFYLACKLACLRSDR